MHGSQTGLAVDSELDSLAMPQTLQRPPNTLRMERRSLAFIKQRLSFRINWHHIAWLVPVLSCGCSDLLGIGDLSSRSAQTSLVGGTAGRTSDGGLPGVAGQGGTPNTSSGGISQLAGGLGETTGNGGSGGASNTTTQQGGTVNTSSGATSQVTGGQNVTAGNGGSGGVRNATTQGGTVNTSSGGTSQVTGGQSGTAGNGTGGVGATGGSATAGQGGVANSGNGGTNNPTGGQVGTGGENSGGARSVTGGQGGVAGNATSGSQALGGAAAADAGGVTTLNFDLEQDLADFSQGKVANTAWQPASGIRTANFDQATYGLVQPITPMDIVLRDQQICDECTGFDIWAPPADPFLPSIILNSTPKSVLIGNVDHPAEEVQLHPGPNCEYAIVIWTAPNNGDVAVEATFTGVYITTTDVHVLLGVNSPYFALNLFDALIDGTGVSRQYTNPSVSVAAGDRLAFIVGCGDNGNYANDSTAVSVQLQLTPQ